MGNKVKIIGISVIAFSILAGLSFAFSQPTLVYEEVYCEETGESFTFGKYTPIEDYVLLPELVEEGLIEINLDTSRILVDEYKGNFLYDLECGKLWKEFNQFRDESEIWHESCDEVLPNSEQFLQMFHTMSGVCRFADYGN